MRKKQIKRCKKKLNDGKESSGLAGRFEKLGQREKNGRCGKKNLDERKTAPVRKKN